jgi:hypothetical protein
VREIAKAKEKQLKKRFRIVDVPEVDRNPVVKPSVLPEGLTTNGNWTSIDLCSKSQNDK